MRVLSAFLVLCFMCTAGSGQAQYASIFGSQSTGWKMTCSNLDQGWVDSVYTNSDTLIGGRVYKKVISTRDFPGNVYLREDTVTGRVWITGPTGCSIARHEWLVCDMSLHLADTFSIGWAASSPDSLRVVDSVFYDHGLKVIRLKNPSANGANEVMPVIYFTEGIGPDRGPLLMTFNCSLCWTPYLLCVYKDGVQQSYSNELYHGDCSPFLAMGLAEVDFLVATLAPDPATDRVTITLRQDANADHVMVFDLSGRIVIDEAVATPQTITLDVSPLSAGAYVVQVSDVAGHTARRKLVISR